MAAGQFRTEVGPDGKVVRQFLPDGDGSKVGLLRLLEIACRFEREPGVERGEIPRVVPGPIALEPPLRRGRPLAPRPPLQPSFRSPTPCSPQAGCTPLAS